MKLNEVQEKQQDEIPFDVAEDLAIFMRNDPMFYRKTFFPAMADVSDKMERGESIDPLVMMKPVVNKGVNSYCKKFIKNKRPDDIFTSKDISSISKHLRLKSDKFVSKYLIMDSDNDYVLKQSPCVFLNEDNSCFIYEYRPKACREYPHTNRKDFHKISQITMKNIEICPAAFNIVEKLKLKLNNNSQKFR